MHAMGCDPKVMATLGPLMTREQTAALMERLDQRAQEQGRTFWAAERKADGQVIGFIGGIRSAVPAIEGMLEIGWRLAWDAWGHGYATEGARATIAHLQRTDPGEAIYAITATTNHRSQAVMKRLGMTYWEGHDFDHPAVPAGCPLESHVTYRLEP